LHLNDIKPKLESAIVTKEYDNEAQIKIFAVRDLWSKSISLDGTIGQRYLTEHRGLCDTSKLEIRFVPKDTKMSLSDDSIKPSFAQMIVIGGSAGLIQQGSTKIVYLAEGAETAASIAQVKKDDWVYCTFGLGNLRKLGEFIKANKFEEVILAADNDGDNLNTRKLITTAINELATKGIYMEVIYPPLPNGLDKSDWNDVLVLLGQQKLRECLEK
tara:strand:+ start:133 stop:777 length:645 start_codon:yes stop_codon:yes gene_type:complete